MDTHTAYRVPPDSGGSRQGWATNYRTIALISHASKVMLKILQARLQQYVNHELLDVQVLENTPVWGDLPKGR